MHMFHFSDSAACGNDSGAASGESEPSRQQELRIARVAAIEADDEYQETQLCAARAPSQHHCSHNPMVVFLQRQTEN